jgi:hypothetical protein
MTDTSEQFLSRWSRLKQAGGTEAALEETLPEPLAEADVAAETPPRLTDDDMPSLETLGDDDDYSGFLSEGVSDALRKQALRRLFLSPKFNVVDGLDDYAEDFTSFAPLGDIITADMKHHMERLLRDQEAETVSDEDVETPVPDTASDPLPVRDHAGKEAAGDQDDAPGARKDPPEEHEPDKP